MKREMAMRAIVLMAAAMLASAPAEAGTVTQSFAVPTGDGPHDVAPAPDGSVWYTAQRKGALGRLDPKSGKVEHVALGAGSAPHGVIIGPDGAPWVTDGGLNAILRVDPVNHDVRRFPLPRGHGSANLNTAAFDGQGALWFTGNNGIYGQLDPKAGTLRVFDAPRGPGPYGITATPDGVVYFASLAGNYLARIDAEGAAQIIEPPTPRQGARRVWSDSHGRLWISEWNVGELARFDPASGAWHAWRLPGKDAMPYAVYVDESDAVWLSDFGTNAVLRFDPASERFESFPSPRPGASVRQLNGRKGEVWAPESATDYLVVYRTE
jgi:virginiamycin B lyase